MTTGELATDACPDKELGVYKPDFMPGECTAHGAPKPTPTEPPAANETPTAPASTPGCRTSRGDGAGQLPFPGGLTVARIPNLKRR